MRKNKKGVMGIILLFLALLSILIIGFIAVMSWGVLDIASDEITPIMENLGVVGDTNVSEVSTYTFGIVDGFVQSTPWLIAFGYVLALIFTLVFVFVANYNPHPAFMGLYIVLMLLLVFGCIVMSNMYQDVYTGNDELALRLQEQTIMSFMILHSPLILSFIAIVGGILMFGMRNTDPMYGGGI